VLLFPTRGCCCFRCVFTSMRVNTANNSNYRVAVDWLQNCCFGSPTPTNSDCSHLAM
jgi:hypothetical protein